MIGEQFECGDEICGAVVNVRTRQEKISLWTKNASNETAQVTTLTHTNTNGSTHVVSVFSYSFLVHMLLTIYSVTTALDQRH